MCEQTIDHQRVDRVFMAETEIGEHGYQTEGGPEWHESRDEYPGSVTVYVEDAPYGWTIPKGWVLIESWSIGDRECACHGKFCDILEEWDYSWNTEDTPNPDCKLCEGEGNLYLGTSGEYWIIPETAHD